MNINDELLAILRSQTKIRRLLTGLKSDEILKVLSRVEKTYHERVADENAKEVEIKQKESAMAEIQEKMKELGLSIDDLGEVTVTAAAQTKKKRQYKERERHTFQYETESGEKRQWFGASFGRKPNEMMAYLKRTGKVITDCIVSTP